MANKIANVLDAFQEALEELMPTTLKAVSRKVLNAANEQITPSASLLASACRRLGDHWDVLVQLQLLARSGGQVADEKLFDLVAAVDGKIGELQESGSAGGNIDRPSWEMWYHGPGEFMMVGAIATVTFTVSDPLAIPEEP